HRLAIDRHHRPEIEPVGEIILINMVRHPASARRSAEAPGYEKRQERSHAPGPSTARVHHVLYGIRRPYHKRRRDWPGGMQERCRAVVIARDDFTGDGALLPSHARTCAHRLRMNHGGVRDSMR